MMNGRAVSCAVGLMLVAVGCGQPDDGPRFFLRASVAPDEPPENEDLGFLVNVQAGIFDGTEGTQGLVELAAVGGVLRAPGLARDDERQCVRVPVSGSVVEDATVYPVLVYPEGRSTRLFAILWGVPDKASDAEAPADGCPSDIDDRVILDSTALIVPPDESEPDAGASTGSTGGAASGTTSTGGGPTSDATAGSGTAAMTGSSSDTMGGTQ